MSGEQRDAGTQCTADDLFEVLPLQVQLDFAALDAGHVEQVGHQVTHPQRFLV